MAIRVSTDDLQRGLPQAASESIVVIGRKVRNALRLCMATGAGRIGFPIVVVHFILAAIGPWLAPYSPTQFNEPLDVYQLQAPSTQFWLGTDQFGRDILSRIMSGATSIISVSVAGAALGIALGTAIGMSSAYRGGRVDEVVMRVMDGLMSFPSLLLALLVLTSLGPSHVNIAATVGIVSLPRVARVIRSVTLTLKTQEFVQSARLRGESSFYIVFREILPNALPVLGVEASIRLSYAILTVSSLGFLGLGVQPPSSDWGLMISQSRQFLVSAPWVALAPAGAVASLIVGVNLLADGLKQASGLPQEKSL